MKNLFLTLMSTFLLSGISLAQSAPQPKKKAKKKTEINTQKSTMIPIDGGTFTMGSNDGGSDEKPTHTVKVSSFSMGKHEVTVAEYKAFCIAAGRTMPDAPSWGWIDNHPIVNVNFDDANAYCKWLSETTGKNYRLPTEAEWEYAARGGTKSNNFIYSGGNISEDVAWSSNNAGGQTQAVGLKSANELGLYDMSGNAWEWCTDWYGDYLSDAQTNPRGPSSGYARGAGAASGHGAAPPTAAPPRVSLLPRSWDLLHAS